MSLKEPPLLPYELEPDPRIGRLSVADSVRRSAPLLVLPVIVLACVAVAYGLLRTPTYTSEARLNVGGLNLTQQSIPGYTTAVQQLAVSYSRAIDAAPVLKPVARASGLSLSEVADSVSATPVQGSPVVRVRATADHPRQAEQLAGAAAQSLTRYAVKLNSGDSQSKRLLKRFLVASREMRAARARSNRLKPGAPGWRAAQVQEDIARLNVQTAGALYQQSQAGQANANLVQSLAPAAPATSDRGSVLQRLLAAALIAGLLIGTGLAVTHANRVASRRIRGRRPA